MSNDLRSHRSRFRVPAVQQALHIALVAMMVVIAGLTLPNAKPVRAAPNLQPPFPRVATIFAKPDENTCEGKQTLAKFNLIVSDFNWWGDRGFSPCVPS